MPIPAVSELAEAVQYNCHVSDARHGSDDSLCVYLMKMREYFRWEKKLPFGAALEREQVGEWLQAREQLWEALEEAELQPLVIDGERFDPFDAEAINARLAPRGLAYSSGLGQRAKPHFVLGVLEQRRDEPDFAVLMVSHEYARDLTAPPAMSLGRTIIVRREAFRRYLWEKLEGWRWTRPDNALGRAFACDDFDGDLDAALDAMAEREIRTLLWHEQGECAAGRHLGADWDGMVMDLSGSAAELMARVVRDHLADCLVTIPALLDAKVPASLHFYVGTLTNLRKHTFPGLLEAYDHWLASGDTTALERAAREGRAHWEALAEQILTLYRRDGVAAGDAIRGRVEAHRWSLGLSGARPVTRVPADNRCVPRASA
jgi:hypothetical protein